MPATIKSQKGENNGHYKHGGKHIANLLEVEIGFSDGKFTKIEVSALKDALALINLQEQRIKELAEENERLKLDVEVCGAELSRYTENIVQMAKQDRADTVRKMQERLHEQFHDRAAYTRSYVHDTIDQIEKEMLEDHNNET